MSASAPVIVSVSKSIFGWKNSSNSRRSRAWRKPLSRDLPFHGVLVHVWFEELVVIAPIVLGVQHRNVRSLDQRLRIGPIIRINTDAHTDGDLQIMILDVVRLTERSEDLVRTESGIFRARYARQQDHEFIATLTADGIGATYAGDQAPGNRQQELVTDRVTQARAMMQQMSYLANHDYLTNLPNRLLLNDRLAQAMAAARRQQQQLAVLFVDVDRFKHINDSLGHAIGDQLLLSVARRLVASVRGSDTVSRQGGDEFVILLSSIARAEDAALSANKILTALGKPHHVKDHDLQITVSMGIGVYPDDGTDAETLVKNADIAMLNAKDNGRNNYQFFKPDMNEHAMERQSLESGLRHALDRREFELFFQPKMDFETETITGAEALIRWRQPGQGIVLPEKFIPIAEQCGYIVPIGRWVLREACRQTQSWLDADLAATSVAINISAVELRSKDSFKACAMCCAKPDWTHDILNLS